MQQAFDYPLMNMFYNNESVNYQISWSLHYGSSTHQTGFRAFANERKTCSRLESDTKISSKLNSSLSSCTRWKSSLQRSFASVIWKCNTNWGLYSAKNGTYIINSLHVLSRAVLKAIFLNYRSSINTPILLYKFRSELIQEYSTS